MGNRSIERSVRPRLKAAVDSLFANGEMVKVVGRGERIRTSDPLVPNQVLYQAEPLPELAIGRTLTDPKSSWLTLRHDRKLP